MKLKNYLLDNLLIIFLLLFNELSIITLLLIFKIQKPLIIIITFLFTLMSIVIILYPYFRKKSFYNELLNNLKELDQKYLILETLPQASFYEGKLLSEILYEVDKSMLENISKYKENTDDFKDYLEMWIHEAKIPISSLTLMFHNDNKIDKKYLEQIKRLDNYIDQVLYYVRSNYTEQDFVFKEMSLEKLISNVALKNKDDLLENKMDLYVDVKDITVSTDPKWLEFILNQIINNSIKYKNTKIKNSYIKIEAHEAKDTIKLSITDNGIGILEKDLSKVFNKSFTGENGRLRIKSTGMGLYIAKKLCTKLGHKIEITSEVNKMTTVTITFGKNNFYKPIA